LPFGGAQSHRNKLTCETDLQSVHKHFTSSLEGKKKWVGDDLKYSSKEDRR